MKVVLRKDESGVSEVVGTILILAMTVVLFSTIIIWVSNIPTPTAQTRVDIMGNLNPVFRQQGSTLVETGDWVNLTHQGGETLTSMATVIYIADQKGNAAPTTDVIHLAPFKSIGLGTTKYGLLDGVGSSWSVGQRFAYWNSTYRSSDRVTVTIVDLNRGIVMWTSTLNPPAGARPPVFLNVYAARNNFGTPLPVQTGTGFYIFAQVMAPDNNLNPNSVWATITYYYGSPSCALPLQMFDDGSSAHGDAAPNDGIFTLYDNACTGSAVSGMDGSIVLFNATDMNNHQTTTRMILHVVPGPTGGNNGGGGFGGSGRPPNLRWNGNQGYNLFNATQWDTYGYSATPTRTFKGGETVVMIIGSLSLQNVFGINEFNLLDPYSGNPAQSVVYGSSKTVGPASLPSTTSAFSFFQFVNGYYVYTYRFKLNDASSVGINYYSTPPQYPRYYWFASYPLSVLLTDSSANRFTTTDSINITADNGGLRTFPIVQTFLDPAYTQPCAVFRSSGSYTPSARCDPSDPTRLTGVVYVQVKMLSVDLNTSMGNVYVGNVMIQDYAGGLELNRAPLSGIYSNVPICPPSGACSGKAIWSYQTGNVYRFSINLARVNQDPWVGGTQNYALVVTSIKDTDENYADVSTQIAVQAPLYKMDVAAGVQDVTGSSWGSNNYLYFFQNFNGFDWWKALRVDDCVSGSSVTTSGITVSGAGCPTTSGGFVQVAFGDFTGDGTLGIAESIQTKTGTPSAGTVAVYRRGVDASGNIVYFPVFIDFNLTTPCTAITAGDVTGDGLAEVVCGSSNGNVWYYRNDGSWTRVWVDQSAPGNAINAVAIGDFNGDGANDIAAAGSGGYLKWYPNLNGFGQFQNSGITSYLFANSEETVLGTTGSTSYLNTYKAGDGVYENVTEQIINVPQQNGSNPNPGFDTLGSWTSGTILAPSTQTYVSSGGNPGGYVQVQTTAATSSVPAGYWQEPFTTSGSQPFSATLSLDYKLTANGATGVPGVTFRAFVDSAPGVPVVGNAIWSTLIAAGTTVPTWQSVTGINVQSPTTRISAPGTYYLKVAMYTTCGATACTTTTGGFDNVQLSWASYPGNTSAMQQYWRLQTLPNRPGTTFTFNLVGHKTGTEDNFVIAYATNTTVTGNDPTTGSYIPIANITNRGLPDQLRTFSLPRNLAGYTIWIRAMDTNRTVTATPGLESLLVDVMNVTAFTPNGVTGVRLTNPVNPGSAINSISAGDQNGDRISDLVVGNAAGNVFKYMGSPGGLVTPTGVVYTASSAVVGVKWGNITTAYAGLQIVVATGANVYFVRADGGGAFGVSINVAGTIQTLGVGDINGDGPDDVVVGTNSGFVYFCENLGGGASWTSPVTIYNVGAQVFSLAIGDSVNSLYKGR